MKNAIECDICSKRAKRPVVEKGFHLCYKHYNQKVKEDEKKKTDATTN